MFCVGAILQSVYDDRRSFDEEAQHDEGHGTEIQQSPAETSKGAEAPLQEASRQVTADSFLSNDAMRDLQLESVRDSQGLSPTASGESWKTKSQTVDQLLQLKDEQLCSTLIREEWGTKKLRTRISQLEESLAEKDSLSMKLKLQLKEYEAGMEAMALKLKISEAQVDAAKKAEPKKRTSRGRKGDPEAGMKQMEQVAKYYENKCKEMQQQLLILSGKGGQQYAALHVAAKRLQNDFRSTKVYLKFKIQSTLDDIIADISSAQLPELPVPEMPPRPPPAPASDPPTGPSPAEPSIPIHKVARLEEQLVMLTNTLSAMQEDNQEVHAEGTENTFLGDSHDPNARFDRALENFAGLNGQLRGLVTKLLAKDVESNDRRIAELEGQNDQLNEEIMGFIQQVEALRVMLRASQTRADSPKPESTEIGTETEENQRPSPVQTEETSGALCAKCGVSLARAHAPDQDISAAIRALSDCVEPADGWQLREFAEQVDCVAQAIQRMPRPRSPKCNGRSHIPNSEQRAVQALHRWQEKQLMLVQRRQRILMSTCTVLRQSVMGRAMAAADRTATSPSASRPRALSRASADKSFREQPFSHLSLSPTAPTGAWSPQSGGSGTPSGSPVAAVCHLQTTGHALSATTSPTVCRALSISGSPQHALVMANSGSRGRSPLTFNVGTSVAVPCTSLPSSPALPRSRSPPTPESRPTPAADGPPRHCSPTSVAKALTQGRSGFRLRSLPSAQSASQPATRPKAGPDTPRPGRCPASRSASLEAGRSPARRTGSLEVFGLTQHRRSGSRAPAAEMNAAGSRSKYALDSPQHSDEAERGPEPKAAGSDLPPVSSPLRRRGAGRAASSPDGAFFRV